MDDLHAAHVPRAPAHVLPTLAPRYGRTGTVQFSVGSTLMDVSFHLKEGQNIEQYWRRIFETEQFPWSVYENVMAAVSLFMEHEHSKVLR